MLRINVHHQFAHQNQDLAYAKLFSVLLILTISSAYSDFHFVKKNKKYFGTSIKLSDRNIISDSNYYFIGKTRNFIFLHDDKKDINDIIPMSEVKMLTEKIK